MQLSVLAVLSPARRRRRTTVAARGCTVPVATARQHPTSRDATAGTIRLRCLTPADGHHLSDLHARLSPDSRYQRYFRLVRSLAPADIARFVTQSPDHLAVGAFDGDVLVGVAQYFRSAQRPDHAEVAVEVADSHHRRGVGGSLVRELSRHAADGGITHFTASILADNTPVLGLIGQSGGDVATTLDGPYADVVVALPTPRRRPDSRSAAKGTA